MRARSLLPALAALAVTMMACQPAGPPSEADDASIRESTDSFVQAALSSDWSTWARMYTENAVLMPPNASLVQGRSAIQAWGEDFPTLTDFSLTVVEIDGRGDLAFVRGTYSITFVPEGAEQSTTDTGKYVEVRRRQPDGSWPMVVDIWNSDLPLPQ